MAHERILIALSALLIAAPATARTSNTEPKAPASNGSQPDTKKYCIQYDKVVGSRVSETQCKTKAEWAKQHVDIDTMLKGE